MPIRPRFDPKRPLEAARDFTYQGVAYKAGDPFAPEGAAERMVARQYEARVVRHTDAVAAPVELVTMTGPQGGRYTITAPWLDEPEVVRGKTNAEARLAALRDEGAPLGFIEGGSNVTVTGGEGGWYEIDAPWLEEPEKVQGRDEAETRQRAIHDAGEPDHHHGVRVTAGENGYYAVQADWQAEPETVHGADAAAQRAAELREAGAPEDGGDTNGTKSDTDTGGQQPASADDAPGPQTASGDADAGKGDETTPGTVAAQAKADVEAAAGGDPAAE